MKLAVFGSPVKQSLSPRIHGLFADQCGLVVDYRAIEATPDCFPERVTTFAKKGGRGCNITAPLKHDAWKLVTRCSDSARRARAVNTLVFSDAGEWFADSTDGEGLVIDLESLAGCELSGARVCLLGAGGAAASVLGALLQSGPETVFVANRTRDRAKQLVKAHSSMGSLGFGTPSELDSMPPFDLVINATSQGHSGIAPSVSPGWFTSQALCYDMNYGSASAPLRAQCAKENIRYSDGLGMLVGQAALSFNLWTGRTPDTTLVLKTLRN